MPSLRAVASAAMVLSMQGNGKSSRPDAVLAAAEQSTGLIDAATVLYREILKHEQLVSSLKKCKLESQKGLAKATELAQEANASQARIGEYVKALLEAIHRVRERNFAAVDVSNSCVEAIDERSTRLSDLLTRFSTIGQAAREINETALSLKGSDPAAPPERGEQLSQLVSRMQALRDEAKLLSDKARADGFEDLVAQADGMAQQLASLQNKLQLLAERLR